MHESLAFPIKCQYLQKVWRKYTTYEGAIKKVSGSSGTTYDAMEDFDLIPSLVRKVEDTLTKKRSPAAAVSEWVRQKGFLTTPSYPGAPEQEDIGEFWSSAQSLARLWDIYRMILNRELEELKKVVMLHDARVPDINGKMVPFGPAITEGSLYPEGVPKGGFFSTFDHTLFFKEPLEEINEKPLRYYQAVAFSYVVTQIERELQGVSLSSGDMHLEACSEKEFLKMSPIIKPNSLLQAMYLQFYILVSAPDKEMKICQECSRPFPATRRDRKYCSDRCKNTAKSRRHRARKKGGN